MRTLYDNMSSTYITLVITVMLSYAGFAGVMTLAGGNIRVLYDSIYTNEMDL